MQRSVNLSENNLKTDIRELSSEIVHNLFLICRKAGIYSTDHPMVVNGVSKPFMGLQRLFGFKKYFCLNLIEGRLYSNNIQMTDAGAVDYLKDRMHELEIETLLFDESLTADQLLSFIGRLVTKVASSHPDFQLTAFLERARIDSILVNHDLAKKLYDSGLHYREGQYKDYSVRRLVADYFTGDIDLAVTMLGGSFESTGRQAEVAGIDYHSEIVKFILPEKFAQLPPSDLFGMANQILSENESLDGEADDKLSRLVRSFDYHPKRDELINRIRLTLAGKGLAEETINKSLSAPMAMRLEVVQNIDRVIVKAFSEQFDDSVYDAFHDVFMRLVRTRQMGKAASVGETIVQYLASDSAVFRQHAIIILKDIMGSAIAIGELEYLEVLLHQMQALFTQGRETFEFSEVAISLLRSLISLRRYEAAAEFLTILGSARRDMDGITIFDSATVRKIFEDVNHRELVSALVRELQLNNNNRIKFVRDLLIAMRSEEVALQLAEIVAHPTRQVRQHCLKVLSELGRPAVNVFTAIIRDESKFLRSPERHELPDEKWFLIRNSIFVLGNLRDGTACSALRLRLSDPDIRVRLELVRALEKIGDDAAADLLMVLAEDPDATVREAAIITLGLFKQPDLLPFFIDIMPRHKGEIGRVISAIAQIGNDESSKFLSSLFIDKDRLKSLSSGNASVSDLCAMISKALEKMDQCPPELKDRVDEGQLSRTA